MELARASPAPGATDITHFLEKKVPKGITDVQSLYTRLKEKLILYTLTQHVYEVAWVNRVPVIYFFFV